MQGLTRGVCTMVAAALLAGCAAIPEVTPVPASPSEPTPAPRTPVVSPYPSTRTPLPTAPPLPSPFGTPFDPAPEQLDAIRTDLTDRGVAPDTMTVISADQVTWNDGSWGCPRPGTVYTQALVEGARVVVEVGGRSYDYRFGAGATPRLCQR
ncbi:MAG: hypothetical protein ACK5LS_11840 [Propioniciclava sp.]